SGSQYGPYTLAVLGASTCPPTLTPTGTPPTATLTSTATATACALTRTGAITLGDPVYNRPSVFNGGRCSPAQGTNGSAVHYDSYEFSSGTGGTVIVSLCSLDGGSANFDAFVELYQIAGGGRLSPFIADPCANAIAAADDSPGCGLAPQLTYYGLSAGYYY